jgi:acetolactate synthase-1/2/3 large subunit
MRSLTKWSAMVEPPSQAAELTARALYHARQGRPRPTALAVPWDILSAAAPASPPVQPVPIINPPLDPDAIAKAGALLAGAPNPMIMVGSGARHAATPVAELARVLQAPVASSPTLTRTA